MGKALYMFWNTNQHNLLLYEVLKVPIHRIMGKSDYVHVEPRHTLFSSFSFSLSILCHMLAVFFSLSLFTFLSQRTFVALWLHIFSVWIPPLPCVTLPIYRQRYVAVTSLILSHICFVLDGSYSPTNCEIDI